jgi:hypothetical protein
MASTSGLLVKRTANDNRNSQRKTKWAVAGP